MYSCKHIMDAKKHEGSIFLKLRLRMRRGRSLSRVMVWREACTCRHFSLLLCQMLLMHLIPYLFWVHLDPLGQLIAMVDLVSLVAWVQETLTLQPFNSRAVLNLNMETCVIIFHTYSSHSLRWINICSRMFLNISSTALKNPHVLLKNMFLAHMFLAHDVLTVFIAHLLARMFLTQTLVYLKTSSNLLGHDMS